MVLYSFMPATESMTRLRQIWVKQVWNFLSAKKNLVFVLRPLQGWVLCW